MIRRLCRTLLLVLLPFSAAQAEPRPTAAPAEVGLSAERLARLDAYLEKAVAKNEVAGAVVLVMRRGRVAHLGTFGLADREAGREMRGDTVFRIASMSKAITSTAVMILYEEGHFLLTDPVSKYIPEFAEPKVMVLNEDDDQDGGEPYTLVPAKREIQIADLLTHTAGITYGFWGQPHISELYSQAGIGDGLSWSDGTLAERIRKLAVQPLLDHPGHTFHYGLSTDVLGYLVEVISGRPLDEFVRERLLTPLGMDDTAFYLPPEKIQRLAALYQPDENGGLVRTGEEEVRMGPVVYSASFPYRGSTRDFAGGAGLVSTAPDYARFLGMMVAGGAWDGRRILSRKTVELLFRDHLRGRSGVLVAPGVGHGLAFGIQDDPTLTLDLPSPGTGFWGGFFHTAYLLDREEALVAVLMTQLYPNAHLDMRSKFPLLVYQAIDD